MRKSSLACFAIGCSLHHGEVEYSGYSGSIVVEGDQLTITHSGMAAKAGGLVRDQPRTIPLQAVSDVAIKEATRLANGWITLGLGGTDAAKLGSTNAPSDPNSVMFRHKDKDQFKQLHDWLVTVVQQNRDQGVDFSSFEYDPAGETRMERVQRKSDEAQQVRQEKQEAKMTQMLGDERPDIVAAASRMGWRMGGKRELKNLADHLHDGETVRFIAQGTYEDKQGIVALTDLRLVFLFHGIIGQAKEDFPLKLISSVQTKSGFATGEIKVHVSGNNAVISGILKNDLEPLANAVRQGMAEQHAQAATSQPQAASAAPALDPYEAMQKMASLRDAGILSLEEFEAKKKELLDRM